MSDSQPKTLTAPIFTLSAGQLDTWRKEFYASPINRLAQNICTTRDPINACLDSQAALAQGQHVGKIHMVSETAKMKFTSTGKRWLCAGLDMLLLAFNKQHQIPDFEFSTAHLLYWHKLERCNYVLHTVVDLLEREEPTDGRSFRYVMKHAVPDGGNWQMFVNLVSKYGVMPSQCYLKSYSAQNTRNMNRMLKSKLHEYSCELHTQYSQKSHTIEELRAQIENMVETIHKLLSILLGSPPEQFTWSYYDQKKRWHSQPNITAKSFYMKMVQPFFDINTQIALAHDPRPHHSYGYNYSVEFSSNMMNERSHVYNNQSMDVLINSIVLSLQENSPVWLACDLQQRFSDRSGKLSLTAHSFELVFGIPVRASLSKSERLLYHETRCNAVLLLIGVALDKNNQPLKFYTLGKSTEDAASKDTAESEKKNLSEEAKKMPVKEKPTELTVDWLREYGFEIVINSRFLPTDVLRSLNEHPAQELPMWDPMGALLA